MNEPRKLETLCDDAGKCDRSEVENRRVPISNMVMQPTYTHFKENILYKRPAIGWSAVDVTVEWRSKFKSAPGTIDLLSYSIARELHNQNWK